MEVFVRTAYGPERPGTALGQSSVFVMGTDASEEHVMKAIFTALKTLPEVAPPAYGDTEKISREAILNEFKSQGIKPNIVGKPASGKTWAVVSLRKTLQPNSGPVQVYIYSLNASVELYEDQDIA